MERVLQWNLKKLKSNDKKEKGGSLNKNKKNLSTQNIPFLPNTHSPQYSVQLLSHAQLFVTPWIAARQVSVSFNISWSSLKLIHWVGDAIQPSHPLSSPSPPAPNPSQHQGLFQWVNSLHEVAKVLEFQPLNIEGYQKNENQNSIQAPVFMFFKVRGFCFSLLGFPWVLKDWLKS